MEYELRIGTAMPVPFQDAGSGTMVFAECQASAMVAPIDEAKYPDRDAINRLGVPTAQSLIAQVLMDLSGKIDALSLSDHKREIEKNMTAALKGAGLQVTGGFEFFKLGIDQASEEMLKRRASYAQMTNDVSMNAATASVGDITEMMKQATAMAAAAKAPSDGTRFCMYCGAKVTGKFCSSCGAQIGL